MLTTQTRRRFLTTVSAAGAARLFRAPRARAAEGTLETTTVRLVYDGTICSPALVAEELLRAEGFTDLHYADMTWSGTGTPLTLANAGADFKLTTPWDGARRIDGGEPLIFLAGIHVGCWELFAREGIRSVADLKGKSVGFKFAFPSLLYLMAAHVGLDPKQDIRWVTDSAQTPMELFIEGKVDGFLAFPPQPQELRARRIGHVILDTTLDRPWSQYFCCMVVGTPEYVRKYPVATKRVLRAILKATEFCASEPARAAQRLAAARFTPGYDPPRYDYALETLRGIPYDKWRDYDAEDSIRFYALRMHEAGMIKSDPNTIIDKGTDWRFLNELKRELKA
jgi:NitT/TauT family transport system substrate-binding protein